MAIEYHSVLALTQNIEGLIKGNTEFFGKLFLTRMKIGFKLARQMDSFEANISKALKSIQIRRNLANSFKNLMEQAKFFLFWKVERRVLVGGRGGGRREEGGGWSSIYLSIYFLPSENLVVVKPDSEDVEELYFQFRKEDKYFPPLSPPSPPPLSSSSILPSFSSPPLLPSSSLPPLSSSRPLPPIPPPSMIQLLKQRLVNIVLLPSSLRHLKRKLIIYPPSYLQSSLKIQAFFYNKLYFRRFRFRQRGEGGERRGGREEEEKREEGGRREDGMRVKEEGRRRKGGGREKESREREGKEEKVRRKEEGWRECLVFIHRRGLKFSIVLKELPEYNVKIRELSDYFGIMAGLKGRIGQIEREILPLIRWVEGKGWEVKEEGGKKEEGGGKEEGRRRDKRDLSGGSRKGRRREREGKREGEGGNEEGGGGRREYSEISQSIWTRYLEMVASLMTLELTACLDFNSRKIIVKGGGFFYKVSWPQELKEKQGSREEEGTRRRKNMEGIVEGEQSMMDKERGGRKLGRRRKENEEEGIEEKGGMRTVGKKRREGEEGRMEEGRTLDEEDLRRDEDVRWVKEMKEHLEKVLEGIFISVDEGKLRILNDKDSFGPIIFKEKIRKKNDMDLESIVRVVDGKGKIIAGIETIVTKTRSK